MSFFKNFFQHNWLMIFYVNFKCLPFSQAMKLPIDIYRKIRINSLKGTIYINSDHICRGMIKFGGRDSQIFALNPCIFDIKGDLIFNGAAELGVGCYLWVNDGAKLIFGNKVTIGGYTKIICHRYIKIGERTQVSWECQLLDTNLHHMKNQKTNELCEKESPIYLGAYNWIGNRCTIMKGVKTPNNTIIASNSLCNKDFSDIEEYSLLAGQPTRIIKSGIKRLFEGVDL